MEKAASWTFLIKTTVAVAVVIFFLPSLTHRATPVRKPNWRLMTPTHKMYIEILGSRVKKIRLKRDGGLYIEAVIEMKIHNTMPVPLKVRGMNMTVSLRSVGSDELYEVGYQDFPAYNAPPYGSTVTTGVSVFNDLRPGVILAQVLDVIKQIGSKDPKLETYTLGKVKLW